LIKNDFFYFNYITKILSIFPDICNCLSEFYQKSAVSVGNFLPRLLFTRDSMRCFARLSHRPRVWLSVCVCVSVTHLSFIKTVQAKITKSLLWAATRSLVFSDKILCPWVRGFFSNKGVKEGYPLEKTLFCRYWLLQCENGCR